MAERQIIVEQCYSTFFYSRHPSLVIEQFGGTLSQNVLVTRRQDQKFAAPLELSTATKGSAAPCLTITVVELQIPSSPPLPRCIFRTSYISVFRPNSLILLFALFPALSTFFPFESIFRPSFLISTRSTFFLAP